jgi:PBP1b-binding outer membrane lipoprotein LpoB
MKTFLNPLRLSAVLGLVLLAAGCATTQHTETYLTAAGFKTVVASTPKQEQRLKSLPPGKISTVQRNGKTYYVFPDVAHNRIYLGTPNEYQNYQQIVADSKIAAQDRVGAEMEAADGDGWNDWDSWEVITFVPN